MKNQDSQDKSLENKDSWESSIPHISDAMLGGNTSSAATSQGGSDSGDECESGEGEFMSMIACKPCMKTISETYGCHFVDEIINKLKKNSSIKSSLRTSLSIH